MFHLISIYLILICMMILSGCTSTAEKPSSNMAEVSRAPEEEISSRPKTAADVLQDIYTDTNDVGQALIELENNDVESMDPESRLIYAVLLYSQGRLDDSRKEIESLLLMNPALAEGWFYLALIEDASGHDDDRDTALDEAIEMDENMVKALSFRGDIAVKKSDWASAEIDYTRALTKNPEDVETLVGLAWVYAKNKKLDKALPLLDEAVRIEPGYTYAWVDRSRVNSSLGNYGEAEHDLGEAIRQEPDTPWHYLDRSRLRLRYFKNHAGALSDLENVERLDRDNFFAMVYLAGLHDEQRRFAQSESYYRKVLSMRPDYIWAFMPMGKFAWMRKEYTEAAKWFGKAAAEDEEDFSLPLMKAMSLLMAEKNREASVEFSETLRRFKQDETAYNVVRFCRERNSDFFAVNSLNHEEDETLRERLWFYMGAIYEFEGNHNGAKAVWNRISVLTNQMEFDLAWAAVNGMGAP